MRSLFAILALALLLAPASAPAALREGARAPDFETRGALAGRPFRLELREQLRHGPLVLYFFPAAFTEGCTLEAHAFSEAAADFEAAGARVVGLSADGYEALRRFSVEACRSSFPVASASRAMIAAYDVAHPTRAGLTSRTSYVITPDGEIIHVHDDPNWREHVTSTLAAVRAWRARQR